MLPGLTRKADYGLRLMLEAAAGDGYISTRSVSRRQKIPYQFLRRSAAVLRENGLITTARGPAGGVRLARPADTISLVDVTAAFGGIALNACTAVPPRCDRREVCPAFPAWVRAQAATEAALAGTSLASVMNNVHKPGRGKATRGRATLVAHRDGRNSRP